jgi:hypothetical protein
MWPDLQPDARSLDTGLAPRRNTEGGRWAVLAWLAVVDQSSYISFSRRECSGYFRKPSAALPLPAPASRGML